jgi:hypothetical protein
MTNSYVLIGLWMMSLIMVGAVGWIGRGHAELRRLRRRCRVTKIEPAADRS